MLVSKLGIVMLGNMQNLSVITVLQFHSSLAISPGIHYLSLLHLCSPPFCLCLCLVGAVTSLGLAAP